MGTESMDKDLVGLLTEEEAAAINDKDAGADTAALQALADAAAGVDDDGEGDDDDAPADPALADAPAPAEAAPAAAAAPAPAPVEDAPAAAPAAAAEPVPEVEPIAETGAPAAQLFEFQLPEGFDDRKEALKTAKAELRERRNQGDLSNEEYDAEFDKLGDEQRELDKLENLASVSTTMREQAKSRAEAERTQRANRFLDTAKKQGVDYNDPERFGFLKVGLDAVQRDPANRGKPFADLLALADTRARRAYAALHGGEAPAPAPAATPAQAKAAAAKARAPDLDAAPKTLAQIPGGDGPGDVGGEFEDVMSLEGEAYEDAVAALAKNPARWARFQSAKH